MPINSFDNYPMIWKPILIDRTPPIYLKLAKQLELDIQSGKLKPGDKLPPQRELADYLDLNLSTITRTYTYCAQKGLICAKVGQGTFVSSDVNTSNILLYSKEASGVIELGTIHPPYNGNDKIIKFAKDVFSKPDISLFLEYRSPTGTEPQRQTIVNWLQKVNIITKPTHILFSTGGQNALCAILLALFTKGDRIGTDPLTFTGLKSVAKMLGIQLIPLPTKNFEIDYTVLKNFCLTEKIKAIYLIPDQHNPTTHTLSENARFQIAKVAKSLNLIIIEDGINRLFCQNMKKTILEYAPENTVYIFSTSKFLCAGLRVAYIITPEIYKSAIEHSLYNINLMISPLTLEIVTKILNTKFLDTIIAEKKKELCQRNKIVTEILSDYDIYGEETCLFRYLILPSNLSGQKFEDIANTHHIQVFCADRFVVGNIPAPNAVRLCISAPPTIDLLRIGLNKLCDILEPFNHIKQKNDSNIIKYTLKIKRIV